MSSHLRLHPSGRLNSLDYTANTIDNLLIVVLNCDAVRTRLMSPQRMREPQKLNDQVRTHDENPCRGIPCHKIGPDMPG